MNAKAEDEKTWQQTKSAITRTTILDAAVDCFFEVGYTKTTTEQIARRAGVSRGAMLHHFPNRFEMISATVAHLNQTRLEMFKNAEARVQAGAQYSRVEAGIDAYWEQLNTPAFIVFHELKVAARTDRELEKVLLPALAEFDKAWYKAVKQAFPDLALSEAFERTNYLTMYLLDGMAAARLVDGPKVPVAMMMGWLKRELRRSYQDVLGKVSRT
ncbi:MAG: TetR/AcrR family transcriptional regulator [Proteobacteria bacterium]|nr:TetR/AcrR family transcriptional regulator [Pseudomonadota bacterium]